MPILKCHCFDVCETPSLSLIDNYVHRLVQNKSDGKLVAVDGEREVCSLFASLNDELMKWKIVWIIAWQ